MPGPEKRPCTEGEVRELSHRMAERSAEHPALASINTLTLESSQGALSCRQVDGTRCTPEQLRSLDEHVAEPLRCAIYELVMGSNPASRPSTGQDQTPTTLSDVSTTPDSPSPTPSSTSTTPSSASKTPSNNSIPQNHNSTAQNHPAAMASHPPGWQHRPVATQNHTSTTGNPNSTPPKEP